MQLESPVCDTRKCEPQSCTITSVVVLGWDEKEENAFFPLPSAGLKSYGI